MTSTRNRGKPAANPLTLGMDAWLLGLDAASVIAMRSVKIAMGGAAAQAETQRMVAEKVEAAWDLGLIAATGGMGAHPETAARRTLAHYGKRVRANRRRLSRPG